MTGAGRQGDRIDRRVRWQRERPAQPVARVGYRGARWCRDTIWKSTTS